VREFCSFPSPSSLQEGKFLRRINRFVVEAKVGRRVVLAHLPNPGRLWEILLPGTNLFLKRTPDRKLPYTVWFAEKEGIPILLHTLKTNDYIAQLIKDRALVDFFPYSLLRREVKGREGRYDFLLKREEEGLKREEEIWEGKSCTLFYSTLSLFPDAITDRGAKHLTHLEGGVLFFCQGKTLQWFLPDFQTDRRFAEVFVHRLGKCIFLPLHFAFSWDDPLPSCRGILTIPVRLFPLLFLKKGYFFLYGVERSGEALYGGAFSSAEEEKKVKNLLLFLKGGSFRPLLPPVWLRTPEENLLSDLLSIFSSGRELSLSVYPSPLFRFSPSVHPLQNPEWIFFLLRKRFQWVMDLLNSP
jgi:sugar fermentation stimulation protein